MGLGIEEERNEGKKRMKHRVYINWVSDNVLIFLKPTALTLIIAYWDPN